MTRGDREAQRGRLRIGERARRPARPARIRRPPTRMTRLRERVLGMALENTVDRPWTPTSPPSRRAPASSRSGSPAAALTSPSVQMRAAAGRAGRAAVDPRPAARRRRAGRPTSAASSPPTRRTPRSSPSPRWSSAGTSPALGVIGRFAVDFVTVQDDDGGWSAYAIELNLRKGGTTHPFLTLQFLTDGVVRRRVGPLRTPARATRSTWSPPTTSRTTGSRALTLDDLFDVVATRRPALRRVPADRAWCCT